MNSNNFWWWSFVISNDSKNVKTRIEKSHLGTIWDISEVCAFFKIDQLHYYMAFAATDFIDNNFELSTCDECFVGKNSETRFKRESLQE